MLKRILCSALLLMLPVFAAQAAETGKSAPAFDVQDINGNPQSIAQYKGKIVVLEWTNPGCPFVKKHYGAGNMQSLQKYAVSKGVIWLTINSGAPGKEGNLDEEGAKASIAKNHAHQTAYILDPQGTLGHLYGAKATPHMFVINAQGKLAYQGAIDDKPTPDRDDIRGAQNYVKEALDALLTGKPVTISQTRAYGCAVKYAD